MNSINYNANDMNFSKTWSKAPLIQWDQHWWLVSLNSEGVKMHGVLEKSTIPWSTVYAINISMFYGRCGWLQGV